MSLISKINEIKDGWKNTLFKNELIQPLIDDRYNTCLGCEHHTVLGVCDLCLCVCKVKAASMLSECPDNPPRWKPTLYCDEVNPDFVFYKKDEIPDNLHKYFTEYNEYIPKDVWQEFITTIDKLEEEKND